jgi:exosortase/archaeosortase family protein
LNSQFSFVILTYNEEMHLPRLLQSITTLNAPVFVLDSGSTDNTVAIGESFGVTFLQHSFENHPNQWDYALKNFDIRTPWVIGLDADHIVTPELKERLANFRDEDYKHVNGIYFNRKNFFKGQWIKHGGYYPFYQLKLIRYGIGYSDVNENMDHRFVVPGDTIIWKDGHILEENLKENNIAFWIEKHNRYSDLVALEELERIQQTRSQTVTPHFWGSPDERRAWLKNIWWKLPRYARPMIYFIYRMFFQLGILDGRTGVIFHFLQGFWFRLIVDIKIDEKIQQQKKIAQTNYHKKNEPLRFILSFIILFPLFYYFNIFFFSITSPGSHHYYSAFLDDNLNYIRGLRWILLQSSAQVLNWLDFAAITNQYDLLVAGHGILKLVYSCLGLGVISFFAAFVISYPKKLKSKIIFLVTGILGIELLNIVRFVVLALFWDKQHALILDHHTIFNIIIYLAIAISLYFWVKHDDNKTVNEAN